MACPVKTDQCSAEELSRVEERWGVWGRCSKSDQFSGKALQRWRPLGRGLNKVRESALWVSGVCSRSKEQQLCFGEQQGAQCKKLWGGGVQDEATQGFLSHEAAFSSGSDCAEQPLEGAEHRSDTILISCTFLKTT